MSSARIITFTTDFGTRDSYVGQMKGAALAVNSDILVVDLCHEVPPQQIAVGAFILETGYSAFPGGTIHVAVVDPGVGTSRRVVAASAGEHLFVAPDNGLLTRVLQKEPLHEAYVVQADGGRFPHTSATFEGRDLLAPAAAWISRGVALRSFGPPAGELRELPPTGWSPDASGRGEATVLLVDRFGNVILDVGVDSLTAAMGHAPTAGSPIRLETSSGPVDHFHRTYAEATGPAPFLLINSAGYLEIAVADGRADRVLRLGIGDDVMLAVDG